MRRELEWAPALVLALFTLSSCGSAENGATESAQIEDGAAAEVIEADDAAEDAQGETSQEDSRAPDGGESDTDRQVVTTAAAVVEVDDTREASQSVLDQVAGVGGHVEAREESTDDDGRPTYAHLTVRVPAEELNEVIDNLANFGDVTELSESARDVTGTVRGLDARIQALETSVERLLEIMSEADTAEELLQVETTLSERQAELESLQAQRNALGDQVALSTLHVTLSTEPVTEVQADGFVGGLQTGWNALVEFVNAVLVVTGAALPWLAVLAVPGGIATVLIRRRVSHRRRAAQSPPEPAEDPVDRASEYPEGGPANHSGHTATQGHRHPEEEHPKARES
ncbi:DUF4349 domain-containing protein [Nesterenkonia haasae]|uniref:DUF4349 domain-containing protein n=1 Tax=Nesterenkonia haasae TaxID=2587813 RepID=UPI001391AFA2|nr:DUF4349 domain-containing protein [Nesterenkonia haasae]NDK32878.1 DUF4349 domain-containing protein [Nesterenkonia haasae]